MFQRLNVDNADEPKFEEWEHYIVTSWEFAWNIWVFDHLRSTGVVIRVIYKPANSQKFNYLLAPKDRLKTISEDDIPMLSWQLDILDGTRLKVNKCLLD